MSPDTFDRLLSRHLDGTASPEERETFAVALKEPQHMDAFVKALALHTTLHELIAVKALQKNADRKEIARAVSETPVEETKRLTAVPAAGERPEIHFGSSLSGGDRKASSRRIARPSKRRRIERPGHEWLTPTLIAAGLLVAVTLSLTVFKASPREAVAQTEQGRREVAEKHRKAQAELARHEEALKKAMAETDRLAAKRKAAEQKLVELDIERQRVEEANKRAEAEQRTAAERDAQAKEMARLEAEWKAEEGRIATTVAAEQKAAREVAKAEEACTQAERQVAVIQRQAAELGQIVFVVDLKGEDSVRPVLVRNEGGRTTRTPLSKGLKIQKGDRIETAGPEVAHPPAPAPMAAAAGTEYARSACIVHAVLELWDGARVDLANGTRFDLPEAGIVKLDSGVLYAEVWGTGESRGQGASFLFKTPFADAEVQSARFDLAADSREAVLQVAEGSPVTFANGFGKQTIRTRQRSVARKEYAPGAPVAIQSSNLWSRGLDGGLVGYWKFDDGAGTAAADSSGCGNTGKLTNGPAWTAGKFGGALNFSGPVSQYVEIPNAANLNPSNALTVCAWIKTPTPNTDNLMIVSKQLDLPNIGKGQYELRFSGLTNENGRTMRFPTGRIFWRIGNSDSMPPASAHITGRTVVEPNTWYHVAGTFRTGGSVNLYVNGVSDAAPLPTSFALSDNGSTLNVGRRNSGGHFNGFIEEVRVYNRELAPREIAMLASTSP